MKINLLSILGILLSASLIQSCGETQNDYHDKHGIKAKFDKDRNLTIQLKEHRFPQGTNRTPLPDLILEPINLSISNAYSPEIHRGDLYINLRIQNLPRWDPEPPFPRELYDQIRIYNPNSPEKWLTNPATLKEFQDKRHNERMRRRALLVLDQPAFSTELIRKKESLFDSRNNGKLWGVVELGDQNSGFAREADLAGLERYTTKRCYTPEELLPDPLSPERRTHLQAIEHLKSKTADDPSAKNCILVRQNSRFISPIGTPLDNSVFINCEPVTFSCRLQFYAAKRTVVTIMGWYDIPNWKAIVEPIQKAFNDFQVH